MKLCAGVFAAVAIGLVAIFGMAMAAPTATSRGTDELVYAQFGVVDFAPQGTTFDEPVKLQRARISQLSIPYHLDGPSAARVHVRVTEPDGKVLVDEVRELPPTVIGLTANFQLDSSYWDGQRSGWTRIEVHPRGSPTELELHLDRVDSTMGGFFFYTNPAVATGKAPLVQNRDIAIVVQTSYGPLGPALLKAPTYARRVNSLAPPWLGWILPELLAGLLLLLGLVAIFMTARGPATAPSEPVDR